MRVVMKTLCKKMMHLLKIAIVAYYYNTISHIYNSPYESSRKKKRHPESMGDQGGKRKNEFPLFFAQAGFQQLLHTQSLPAAGKGAVCVASMCLGVGSFLLCSQ